MDGMGSILFLDKTVGIGWANYACSSGSSGTSWRGKFPEWGLLVGFERQKHSKVSSWVYGFHISYMSDYFGALRKKIKLDHVITLVVMAQNWMPADGMIATIRKRFPGLKFWLNYLVGICYTPRPGLGWHFKKTHAHTQHTYAVV